MPSIAPPSHTRRSTTTDDWITPQWLIARLGLFDLDPCASPTQPWPCAKNEFRLPKDDGLEKDWTGEVWLNPPYGKQTGKWLKRLAHHKNGMALVFARTETKMFFEEVWPWADSILFLRGRLTFSYPDGTGSPVGHNSGGPSVLIAYGPRSVSRLLKNPSLGAIVKVEECR